MNLNDILPELPKPNVEHIRQLDELDEDSAKGMLCNPIYAGVPPFGQVVSDEAWVGAAAALIREEGPEQFLVNLLYVLRASMADAHSEEIFAEDMDELWVDEDLEFIEPFDEEIDFLTPWQLPLEGDLFCSHDDLPMLFLEGEYVCVAEFVQAHINSSPITDIITEPLVTLIFQNGHTLPLLCPSCGNSIHVEDEEMFLDTINGLTVLGLGWDDEEETLVIDFGHIHNENIELLDSLPIHLNSVRGLTCPHREVPADP
ncbi:MAG: hypothetical protein ACE5H9_14550 [Anaerolineae bacterium]